MRKTWLRLGPLFALLIVGLLCAALENSAAQQEGQLRFFAIDLVVDSGEEPLAAWQVDLTDRLGIAKLTGVEGGEFTGFQAAPTYDPRALQGAHVKLAAFHLLPGGPRGATRVARLHFVVEGPGEPDFQVTLTAAASPDGTSIQPLISIEQ